MDQKTARLMSALTTQFYQHVGSSFSATRQAAWDGWHDLLAYVAPANGHPLQVLDLACGNLRFERFLAQQGVAFVSHAFDNCDELVMLGKDGLEAMPGTHEVDYHHIDLAETLFGGQALAAMLNVPPCDLCVAFGFMHHLALPSQREQVIEAMVGSARPGGVIAVTFWQFAHNKRLMSKAVPVEGGDEGDYLLGWQQERDVWRYCHSFSESEIDGVARSCGGEALEI